MHKSKALLAANKELAKQNEQKQRRAEELHIANKELAFQNKEKEIRAAELLHAINQLKNAEEYQKEYAEGLKQMMFITSHRMRKPIAHILGISNLLDYNLIDSPEELKKMIKFIKVSAETLDNFTRDLTAFIYQQEEKVENKHGTK
jgi:signal transduction histidine kinase